MRYKLTFLGGAALGYVFGARAGRARYEQLSNLGSRVAATEPVQRARETVIDSATEIADKAKVTVVAAVAEGRHRVEDALGDKLPDRLRSTDAEAEADDGIAVAAQRSAQTVPGTHNGAGAGI